MITHFAIHEFGVLHRGVVDGDLDSVGIPAFDWDWLLKNEAQLTGSDAPLFRSRAKRGKQVLQVLNYVGTISLPSGGTLEILPKTEKHADSDTLASRKYLIKMITKVNDIPFVYFGDADLQTLNRTLPEILIGKFLQDVQHLINRGLRSQYILVDNEEPFLKGKLKLSAYLRTPPPKRTHFPVQYDDYLLARPENRVLHWALHQAFHWSQDSRHRSHARKLLMLLSSIPVSSNPIEDLAKWQDGRLMQHYHRVKPWIALIINHLSPLTQAGATAGVSMLFPMEKLFEKYVFKVLKERIKNGYSLRAQPSAGWLSHHRGEERFNLKPDLLLQKGQERICIMDTKWKLLDETATDRNYDLSQSDIYQLYAYGQKCLPDGGDLFLIYPRHKKFQKPLQPFHFGSTHTLWAVPFCLETDELLIAGDLKIVGYSPAITHTPQTAQ